MLFGIIAVIAGVTWEEVAPVVNAPGIPPALSTAIARKVVRLGVDHVPPPLRPTDYETRREEGFEAVIADDLARHWGSRVTLVEIAPQDRVKAVENGRVDALLVRTRGGDELPSHSEIVRSGYDPELVAVMRSDTTIRAWDQLAGRTVCISNANDGARALAHRLGAIVAPGTAPAKSLATMRTGACDATIEDSVLMSRMVGLERWVKYDAMLPAREQEHLVFAVARGDHLSAEMLRKVVARWRRDRLWAQWVDSWVGDVDYEVFLEQDAPDCH